MIYLFQDVFLKQTRISFEADPGFFVKMGPKIQNEEVW